MAGATLDVDRAQVLAYRVAAHLADYLRLLGPAGAVPAGRRPRCYASPGVFFSTGTSWTARYVLARRQYQY